MIDSHEKPTKIVTFGGWARSGKGTSTGHLKGALENIGQKVVLIDQGIKFRSMAAVALEAGQPLDGPLALDDFLQSQKTQDAVRVLLAEVNEMTEVEKQKRLYTPELSSASGKVGMVPNSHGIAVEIMRAQVQEAVEEQTDTVIIDGRSIEKYAREFEEEGLAKFAVGWFFKCDPAIAARRSLGLHSPTGDMSPTERERLFIEILSISDRNRSDTLRPVDPLSEPMGAYHLDLHTYSDHGSDVPFKRGHDIMRRGNLGVVDTSYTNSISEMTDPVTNLTLMVMRHRAFIPHEYNGSPTIPIPE